MSFAQRSGAGVLGLAMLFGGIAHSAPADTPPSDAGKHHLNATDFGAKCDGQTDDTAALQAAASKAAAAVLELPAGVCKISAPIVFHGNLAHLHGQGVYVSVIFQTSDDADAVIFASDDPANKPIYGGQVSDLWIRHKHSASRGVGLRIDFPSGFYASNVDIRDFYRDVVIEGGGGIFFTNTTITSGGFFDAFAKGSSLITVGCGEDRGRCRFPGEIFLSNVDAKGTPNNFVETALRIEAVDGLWINNAHLGFADTQVMISPSENGGGVQSVYFTNVGLDGNNSARTGLAIPPLKAGARFVKDVVMVGGDIEDLTGDGVDLDEPGAQLTMTGVPIRHVHGWGIDVKSAAWVALSNALIDDVGSPNGGAVNLGGAQNASVLGLGFSDIKGACLNAKPAGGQKILTSSLSLPASCGR